MRWTQPRTASAKNALCSTSLLALGAIYTGVFFFLKKPSDKK
jgi:hypothetical protein